MNATSSFDIWPSFRKGFQATLPRTYLELGGCADRRTSTSRTDPSLKTETLVLNGNDNVLSRTDREGQITTTTYDALDWPLITAWQGGVTTSRTCDAADGLTQITDSVAGTITRQYDVRFDTLTQDATPLHPNAKGSAPVPTHCPTIETGTTR